MSSQLRSERSGIGRSLRAEGSGGSVSGGIHREASGERPHSSRSAERPRRALADKWILGEELGRGAHGQARGRHRPQPPSELGPPTPALTRRLPCRRLQVFKGIDQSTGGVVAIKEVSLEGASADELQSEIDFLRGLNHRNVVQYLGTFKARGVRGVWRRLMPQRQRRARKLTSLRRAD